MKMIRKLQSKDRKYSCYQMGGVPQTRGIFGGQLRYIEGKLPNVSR